MKKLIVFLSLLAIHSCSKSSGVEEPDNVEEPDPIPDTENTSPSIPIKVFPTDGLLCVDNPLEFSWDASTDNEGDSVTYEIELAEDDSFSNIIEKRTISEPHITLSLEKGIQVSWRVRAKDSKGKYSSYSPSWNFYSEGEGIVNYLPFPPTLIYPQSFSLVEEDSFLLEWASSDVDGDLLSYDVYFGESSPPSLIKENISESSYEITITPDKTYYWQIVVKDGKGGESIGNIWTFKS